MKRMLAVVLTLLITATALAFSASKLVQKGPLAVEIEQKNPWNNLELKNRPENFQFAFVSDRTGGHRPGIFPAAVDKINLLQPEFVVSVGDLIEGYTRDRERLEGEWKEFNGFVAKLETPFFYVPGNHDITNQEVMLPLWQEQFGRTYYYFLYHDVLFVMLNSEDPPNHTVDIAGRKVKTGRLGEEQLAWLKQVLDAHQDVRWTILVLHKPMWQYGAFTNWNEVEKRLGERKRTVFAGHHHRYAKAQVGDNVYYALATTGGGSRLGGPADGQFDHIVWVTMTEQGPRVANLMLDGIWTDDPVTEGRAKRDAEKEKEKAE